MCYLLVVIFGYFIAMSVGHLVISEVIKYCWILLEKDWNNLSKEERGERSFRKQGENKEKIKALQGTAEIALYITAIIFFKHPEWIGAWLTLKLVVSWKSFDQNKIYSSHNIFLLGNALTIIFALFGSFIILKFPFCSCFSF